MDTAGEYRLSSQVSSSKDDNAPYGAITKSVRSGTLLAPKEYPEKCRCSACSGPTRLAGRPGRNAGISHPCSSLRPSERIKHRVRLDGLTSAASRPPPPHGRARVGCSRRHPPPPHPCGPAQSRPAAEPASSARTKGAAANTSTSPARGLGGKAPIRNPVRGPRNVERTYGLFAVSERAANASLFAARRVQGNMRSEGV